MRIGYGVCVGSWDRFHRYVVPHAGDSPVLGLAGQTSIAAAYNSIIRAFRNQGLDVLVLQHDDLEITDPEFESKLAAEFNEPDVALVGVAGARSCDSLAWWERDTLGHQNTDSGLIDFGERHGPATILEGSLLAFSTWWLGAIPGFDGNYPGFHGYDEIALEVGRLGGGVVVADIDTHHHVTPGQFKSDAGAREWAEANRIFQQKWMLGNQEASKWKWMT